MKKIFFFISLILLLVSSFLIIFLLQKKSSTPTNSGKIVIITTLFPLYDMAKNIGQDKVSVSLLLPPGVEAHAFEPKPSDLVKINQADLFVYTGKFMEPWADGIIAGTTDKKLVVVNASLGITLSPSIFVDADEPAGAMDPHIWLDFDNAKTMTQTIALAMSEKDPSNANYYQQNAAIYLGQLSAMDERYKTTLSQCSSTEIVYGGHYAFGYLAQRYHLRYLAAQGLSPDAEPTAKDLVNLIAQIQNQQISSIFYEELASPKIAETIVAATHTQMLPLNAAHNLTKADFENQVSFLSIMEQNLTNLSLGLNCKK